MYRLVRIIKSTASGVLPPFPGTVELNKFYARPCLWAVILRRYSKPCRDCPCQEQERSNTVHTRQISDHWLVLAAWPDREKGGRPEINRLSWAAGMASVSAPARLSECSRRHPCLLSKRPREVCGLRIAQHGRNFRYRYIRLSQPVCGKTLPTIPDYL
jgi:hypothetical protein